MRRTIQALLVVGVVLGSLVSCDWLFGPRVQEVAPEDLASFDASQTVSPEKEAVQSVTGELIGIDGGGLGCALIQLFLSDEFQAELEELLTDVDASHIAAAIPPALAKSRLERLEAITADGSLDLDDSDDEMSVDFNLLIEDETLNAADWGGVGSATVERFFLNVGGTGLILTRDENQYPESVSVEGSLDHDASISYSGFSCDGNIVIHDGQINSEASGRLEYDIDATTASIFWRFGIAVSAGVSFTNTVTDEGGKLIVEFAYAGRENFELDIDATDEELEDALSGSVDLSLVVRLYDNNDALVAEHTYTDEDLLAEFDTVTF